MKNQQTPRAIALMGILAVFSLTSLSAQEETRANTKTLTADALAPFGTKLSDNQKQTLLTKGFLTIYYSDKAQTSLCPSPAAEIEITPSINAVKPSIGIETLVVYPLPANLISRPDRDIMLYNIMHRYRSMEGIEYWSASRKAMRIFFTSSKLVKTANDRTAITDPVYTALEQRQSFFLEQEDSSFGKNLYDLEVRSLDAGSIMLNMINREQVWYGIIPVLSPRALSMFLFVQPSTDGKYLYFYGNTGINAAKAFGVEEKAKTSFTNRMIALFNWYAREMEAVK